MKTTKLYTIYFVSLWLTESYKYLITTCSKLCDSNPMFGYFLFKNVILNFRFKSNTFHVNFTKVAITEYCDVALI